MAFINTPLLEIRGSGGPPVTAPQPAWGSWISAVVSGSLAAPSSSPITVTLGNACVTGNDASQLFVPGTAAWLIDPGVSFAGANAEMVIVGSVSGNNLTINPKPVRSALGLDNRMNLPVTEFAHVAGGIGTGTYILSKQNLNNILVVYEDGGTGPWLYLGNSIAMTSSSNRIFKLSSVSSGTSPTFYNSGMFTGGNPFDMSELWILGTAGDKWTVSANVD